MTHETVIHVDPSGRYPYKAVCLTCGWTSWGYLAEHAAQGMADDHLSKTREEVAEP